MALQVYNGMKVDSMTLDEAKHMYLPDEYHAKLTQMATAKALEIEKAHEALAKYKHFTQVVKNPYKPSALFWSTTANTPPAQLNPQMLADAMQQMVGANVKKEGGVLEPSVPREELDPRAVLTALMIARDRHTHLGWGAGWEGPCIGTVFGVGPTNEKLKLHYGAEALEYVVVPNTPEMEAKGYIGWNDTPGRMIEDVFAAIDAAIVATEKQLAVSA